MTEPSEADLDHTRELIDEAKETARDLRQATPDPDPLGLPVDTGRTTRSVSARGR
ncbi:hypothetical protein ABZ816_33850 [Actinosynnema sp. NPDC047251]|uniref:Uncharacterized protein n=1 Tax=Saccharothrix espanaensis (strain ATCC 51144 / DSM 44229 / JCM 9112 / NBRC 15066 / NRRL 15764) TaxID=1179773 RepID=K0K487_SACES|nr:hypothetical protein [Saccharothrix espanaensis]CCH33101.1 hypothetical protein BN6_58430 [Saccharothrix espanaensis DSM 44229]